MDLTELAFTSAVDLAARIRAKEISPVEVVDGFLERVERLNPSLNAFSQVRADEVRAEAARLRLPSRAESRSARSTAFRSSSRTR